MKKWGDIKKSTSRVTSYSIMEIGKSKIGKGCRSLNIYTSSPLTFCSNPEEAVTTPADLMLLYDKFISNFSSRPQAIGSRVAMVLFGNNFEKVSSTPIKLSKEVKETNKAIVEAICSTINQMAGKIVNEDNILQWLKKPLPEYNKVIDGILKGSNPLQHVKDFWSAQKEAYRHLRGAALKQAVLDFSIEHPEHFLLDGEYDVETILDLADEHVNNIVHLNTQSLRSMLEAKAAVTEYLLNRFEALSPDYLKVLTALVCKFLKDSTQKVGDNIPLIQVGSCFETLSEKFKVGSYTYYSKLEQKIPENLDKINRKTKLFGYEVLEVKNEILVRLINPDIFELASILFPSDNSGKLGKTGNLDKSLTEFTQNTQLTQSRSETKNVKVEYVDSSLGFNCWLHKDRRAMCKYWDDIYKKMTWGCNECLLSITKQNKGGE